MPKIALPLDLGGREYVDVDTKRVLCNDVILPGERNPKQVELWLISSVYGPMGAVWASSLEGAIDILADADLAKAILVDPADIRNLNDSELEQFAYIGNNGLPADLSQVAAAPIPLMMPSSKELLNRFARARDAGADTLADVV